MYRRGFYKDQQVDTDLKDQTVYKLSICTPVYGHLNHFELTTNNLIFIIQLSMQIKVRYNRLLLG